MNEDVGTSSTKQTHSKLLIAVTASQRAEAKGKKNNQNRPSVWVLKKTAGAEITWKGLQSSPSNFSVSHLHSLSPANPVMCVCLQYTDFSRTVIGSFVLSYQMGVLKREVSLSRRDIHSVLLCSARPTEWGAADGRTDGRTAMGRWRRDEAH